MAGGVLARSGLTARLLAVVLPLVALLTAATGWVTLEGSRRVVDAFGTLHGQTVAESYVQTLRAQALQPEEAVIGVARTIGTLVANGTADRRQIADNLQRALEAHPPMLATWFFAEPDAIGADRDHRGGDLLLGHPRTGRFQAYVVRDGDRIVTPPTLPDFDNDDWYRLPKQEGRMMFVGPYTYPVLGRDVLMSSFAVPVYAGGRFVGVVGFDVAHENRARRLDVMRPLGGRIMIASMGGLWTYHPVHALIGQPVRVGSDPTWQLTPEELSAVRAVRPFIRDLEGVTGIDGPVRRIAVNMPYIDGERQRLLIVDLPLGALLAPFERLKLFIAAGTALAALAVLLALHVAVTRMVGRPLARLRGAVGRLDAGELAVPVPETGRPDEIGAIATALERFRLSLADRERLRQELERMGAAMQAAQDAITIVDAKLHIVYANPAAAELLGAPGPETLLGRTWHGLVAEAGGHRPGGTLLDVLAAQGRSGGELTRCTTVFGRQIEVMQFTLSRLPSGEAIAVFRDVSEIRRGEHERAELQAQLLQQDKMDAVGRLAGGIAHDFNNLLGAMLGYVEFLVADLEPGSRLRDYAVKASRVGHRAKDLVRQILTFSRTDAGEFSPVSLTAVTEEARTILRSSVPASTRLTYEVAPGLPPVRGNATQLVQVLMNLVLNAHDARVGERGRIQVRAFVGPAARPMAAPGTTDGRPETVMLAFDPAQDHMVLEVEDDGRGIAPAALRRLFEPFYTTKDKGKGTGLGMAVVYGIVKAHGGGLSLRTGEGKGTVMRILLPLAEGAAPRRRGPRGDAALPDRALRLLVVEDEHDMAEMLREGLSRRGHQVTLCRDAETALDLAIEPDGFDAVLTDQTMPGMSGLRLIAALKARAPALICALCSGYGESDAPAAESAGADAYFQKPLEVAEVSHRLESLVAARQPVA